MNPPPYCLAWFVMSHPTMLCTWWSYCTSPYSCVLISLLVIFFTQFIIEIYIFFNNSLFSQYLIYFRIYPAFQHLPTRVSTEFRQHGIPRNFLTSEVISAKFRRNSAKFRGIPRNFAGIEPEITSVFRGMPKCHFRGHPTTNAFTNFQCRFLDISIVQ